VPVLDPPNVLLYFGALAATAASVAVIGHVPGSARGTWVLLVSLAFLAAFAVVAAGLLARGWIVPGGVVAATAVTFVPLAGAGFERLIGIGQTDVVPAPSQALGGAEYVTGAPPAAFHGGSFALALLTAAAGLAAFALVRYAYVFAWVAVAAVVATQILLPVFDAHPDGAARFDALLGIGLLLMTIGVALDRRGARREAFWWNLVGAASVTAGFSYHDAFGGSWSWILALLAGLAALGLAVYLRRATYAFFGLLGLYVPLAHFLDSWLGSLGLAIVLALVGATILAAGMALQRSAERLPAIA
jgi:hypothetical protein